MAEQEVKKDLWKMKKESLFIDFFQWMWGIHAPTHYKTACPYYWQYAGSMVIFPLILLWKLGVFIVKPITGLLDDYAEVRAQQYVAKLRKQFDNAKDDADFYSIFKSKCYQKYRYDLWDGDKYTEYQDKVHVGYVAYEEELKKKKQLKQAKIDNFKYGTGGTIISWIFGLGVLSFIGWGIYAILHLFTWGQFTDFMLTMIGVFAFIGIVWGIIYGFRELVRRFWCDSWIYKIVFWKYIGMFFVLIWTGIRMFFDMVKRIYTKNCPIIEWE